MPSPEQIHAAKTQCPACRGEGGRCPACDGHGILTPAEMLQYFKDHAEQLAIDAAAATKQHAAELRLAHKYGAKKERERIMESLDLMRDEMQKGGRLGEVELFKNICEIVEDKK